MFKYFTGLLLFIITCSSFENHPVTNSKIVLFGLKPQITLASKNDKIHLRVRVLAPDSMNPGAPDLPVNKTTIKVYSPFGAGQFFETDLPKKNCPDNSGAKMQGGLQFFKTEDDIDYPVCVPFELKTDAYGEGRIAISNFKSDFNNTKLYIIFTAGRTTTSYNADISITATE